jgi:hypothetical protein
MVNLWNDYFHKGQIKVVYSQDFCEADQLDRQMGARRVLWLERDGTMMISETPT